MEYILLDEIRQFTLSRNKATATKGHQNYAMANKSQ